MSRTFSIYQDTDEGLLRIGTFTQRKAAGIHHLTEEFFAKHPEAPRGKMYGATRYKLGNEWFDHVASRFLLA